MGIFDRFLKKSVTKLSFYFQDNELIKFFGNYSLKKESILDIQPQQNAMISGVKKGFEEAGSFFVNEEGEYALNKQVIGTDFVNILFLNTKQRIKRRWLSAYQPSDKLLENPLAGEYSISIENGRLLVAFLEKNYSGTISYDEFIDQWIGFSIDQILIRNKILSKDIIESGDRLTSFLCQALQEDFKKYGLILHKIKRTEVENSASFTPKIEIESKPEPIVIDNDPPPLHDDQKMYYRVKNGQLIGPYSGQEIQQLIDQNDLSPNELLWRKGLSDWKSADSFDIFIWD